MQLLRPIVVLHLITMIQTACDTVGPCRDNCGENASCPTANGLPQILATNFPRIPLVSPGWDMVHANVSGTHPKVQPGPGHRCPAALLQRSSHHSCARPFL
eukprot:3790335-Rhodomonas_salina.3